MNRKLILAAAIAAGSLAGIAQAAPAVVAGTYYDGPSQYSYSGPTVYVQSAPPAPIYEVVPGPRAGFVWSPGHYEWRNGNYVWLSGQWLQDRPGYAWRAPEWQRRDDGSWFFVGGSWVAGDRYSYNRPYGDRDRDGVPNAYDARPNVPNGYYGRAYRDRDGDGVPNQYDTRPGNPYRN